MKSIFVVCVTSTLLLSWTAPTAAFNLTLLHTNDVHARFEEFNKYGTECSKTDSASGKCFGGVARRATKIREIRSQEENVLLLDAGDQFQGTLWFFHYQGDATAYFMNKLEYDAMALGNHEFDLGVDGLLPFLRNVSFPVLVCNMDDSGEPSIQELVTKYVEVEVAGERIGVIGYIYSHTDVISPTGDLTFSPEVTSIQEQVDILTSKGINKIIAVGHSGINIDETIAREVRGVDVVIGGHTNTFLYTGEPPEGETTSVYGPYPLVINPDHDPSLKVLVVQDYTMGKYLGSLHVVFDTEGDVIDWGGNPILLDASVEQDPDILVEVQNMSVIVKDSFDEVIGESFVFLEGDYKVCRLEECNLGNLIAEAMLWEHVLGQSDNGWSDVSIALISGGSIRNSILAGEITIGDVYNALPFGNTNDIFEIEGVYLLEALEVSVMKYEPNVHPGEFLQHTGLRVKFNLNGTVGNRVDSVEVMCTNCSFPRYEPLDQEKVYRVVTTNYMADGGDGFTMFRDHRRNYVTGNSDATTLTNYIKHFSPLTKGVYDKIKFTDDCPSSTIRLTPSILQLLCTFAIPLILLSTS